MNLVSCRTAWNGLKGLSKAGALTQYVEFVTILAPEWQSQEVGHTSKSIYSAPNVVSNIMCMAWHVDEANVQ